MSNDLIIKGRLIKAPILDIIKTLKGEITNGKLSFVENKSNDWIRVSCPIHSSGLEKNASAGIYDGNDPKVERGTLHCFTCGAYIPLYKVVAECLDKSEDYAKDWLIDNFGEDRVDEVTNLQYINLNKKQPTNYIDESILDTYQSWHPYMAKRKLTQEICNLFKVKYDSKSDCIVFPAWDEKNNLVMLTKRSVTGKNFYLDKKIEKPVYLLNYIKDNNIKEVIVCESQINALTLFTWGYPSIATFGCNISKKQFEVLNKSGIEHYYLAFDGDDAGKKGTRNFIKNIKKDVLIDVIELPKGKDVNDLTLEEFDKLKTLKSFDWLLKNKI